MFSATFSLVLALLAAPAAAVAQTPDVPVAAAPSDATKVLIDQATYWMSQNQPAQARRALDRLLRLEPRNADGLALQALLQAGQGDRTGAQASMTLLRQIRPDDQRLATIEQTLRASALDSTGLADARQLATGGRPAEAVARYQGLFRNGPPPGPLAVEYYQTLAATPGGWDQAREGLGRLAANAQDLHAQLAYAELLTYRPPTRADGIARLAALAQNSPVAAAATKDWRQALEWLPVDTSSIPAYQAYLDHHPDNAIAQLLQSARNPPRTPADEAAQRRSAGFAALNAGRLAEADTAFHGVLAQNPNDADALGGLGLERLRQGRTEEARELLSRAIAADPARKARWEQALAGASVSDDYARARSMIQRGQLGPAEQLLRGIIGRGGDVAGAQGMLADLLVRRGDLPGAEANYRAALTRQPNNADLLVGMAQVLTRQGRDAEADALLARIESTGKRDAIGRLRADQLRQRAATLADPMQKVALLRTATEADPSNPWIKLDLARALSASGQKTEARNIMAGLATGRSTDALRASALFATEEGRPADAASIIARLPAAARGPDLQGLLAQAQVQTDISAAMALAATSPLAARQKLLTLAAAPDPDGGRGVAIARAFTELRDPAGAREALATAQAATRTPTPAQRLAYAGALLAAGDETGARTLVASLQSTGGLTADQQAALAQLQLGMAVRASDTLNADGRPADAYDTLAQELTKNPNDPALNLALARLYQSTQDPRRALSISLAVLSRNPSDMIARRAAVSAAIQTRAFDRAEALVREGMQLAPNDPQVWIISADLARAQGNNRRALQDLRTARSLREQQMGVDAPPAGRQGVQVASLMQPPGTPESNPFRRSQPTSLSDASPVMPGLPPADATLADIDRQMTGLREELAPKVTLGPGLRVRTGTAGLDQLSEVTTPVELMVMPFGRGRATIMAMPTFLSAGEIPQNAASQAKFGTAAFGGKPLPPSQHAEGVGFDAAYELGWLRADVGSTPVGFPLQSILGGVELSPQLADGVLLRLRGERRAVTDSVLSYAGTRDTTNRTLWGGVTRTGGHGQLEFTSGQANFYAGGGWASVNGTGVASNTTFDFGAGGNYPVWRNGSDEVRLGFDLVYFGYDKNLRYFSLGHGGYFSPQSYIAALIPVSYTSRSDTLTWSVGGALGYQTYHENTAPVFPNDARLQALLVSQGGGPTGLTEYPGRNASGITGSARGSVEYRVNTALLLGARGNYQHAGNWSEFGGALYARYIFNGDTR